MKLANWRGIFPIELDTKRLSPNYALRTERSASNLSLKDSCALSDQMSFVPAFPWRFFVLAVGNRDRANKNEIAIIVFGVTTKDLSLQIAAPRAIRARASAPQPDCLAPMPTTRVQTTLGWARPSSILGGPVST